jgi:hypothetical protein
MSVPFSLSSTFYGGQGVSFRGLTTLLGLVNDPENQRNEKGYKHRPEKQREQYAEEATAHHRTPAEDRAEQQNDDRPGQRSNEYLQAVAHGLLTRTFLLV